jgi:hypothetical protein
MSNYEKLISNAVHDNIMTYVSFQTFAVVHIFVVFFLLGDNPAFFNKI